MKITVEAPAKINLYLDVFPGRGDGYHNIKSIMHTVSLADVVTVDTEARDITVTCTDSNIPTDSGNLAYRAAKAFLSAVGINSGAKIHIEKKIPVAGGLAGGSTDAAAVLKALNDAFNAPMSIDSLCKISAAIGADVPFCIKQGCALCTGIGDVMTPLPTLPKTVCLIANGGEGVSTPAAYRRLDEMYGEELTDNRGNIDAVISSLKSGDLNSLCHEAFNIFESAVLSCHSTAGRLKDVMSKSGAVLAMMSGSGPSVFGLFENRTDADKAADEIRSIKGTVAHICNTL